MNLNGNWFCSDRATLLTHLIGCQSRGIIELACSVWLHNITTDSGPSCDALKLGLNGGFSPHTDEPMGLLICPGPQCSMSAICSITSQLHISNGTLWSGTLGSYEWRQTVKTHCCVLSSSHWEASVQMPFETISQKWFQCILQKLRAHVISACWDNKGPSSFNVDGMKNRILAGSLKMA